MATLQPTPPGHAGRIALAVAVLVTAAAGGAWLLLRRDKRWVSWDGWTTLRFGGNEAGDPGSSPDTSKSSDHSRHIAASGSSDIGATRQAGSSAAASDIGAGRMVEAQHDERGVLRYPEYLARQMAASDLDRKSRLLELHRAALRYTFAVHGGPEEAAAAGCTVPPPEQMPEHRDFKLFNTYCGQLRVLLEANDVEQAGSGTQRRLHELVSAMRALLPRALAENLRLLRECRFANLSTLESLEALGQLSAPPSADGAADEDPAVPGADGEAEVAVDSRSAQLTVLRALQLRQEQVASVLEARQLLRADLERLGRERQALVARLRQFATGQEPSQQIGVGCARRLRRNMEDEAKALQTFHAWFLCTMLTMLQHARADVMAAPQIPDPLTLAELLAQKHNDGGSAKR